MPERGQDVQQEPADELAGLEPHHLHLVAALSPVILPTERNGPGVCADKALVRYRHAVGVPAEIGEDSLRPAEGRFGVVSKTRLRHADDPFGFAERSEAGGEGRGGGQSFQITEELKLPCLVQCRQPFQEEAPEQAGQDTHGQKETRAAGDPACSVR